eukprot:CAMPEP_0198617664 /NCGR_PEP_ID=MMETSP1462-20131121/160504_1 /TAXON_ID=1333877 /ORGANISM="Brandtodinium nutriculum, Strain RCC3387" /LENGTH=407 /DNA_ID=CAMNT_0044349463 /DNA_START=28 /DNA_END=1248 /DNA_ORIENTATION=+
MVWVGFLSSVVAASAAVAAAGGGNVDDTCPVEREEASALQVVAQTLGQTGGNCMPGCSECAGNQFACTCPTNCNQKCYKPVRCGNRGLKTDGHCTPFYFRPDMFPNCQGTAPYFGSGAIVPTGEYQVYKTSNPDQKWVVHACDHAGIQTDCKGDIGYLEYFSGHTKDYGCPIGVQGIDHNSCSFKHPAGVMFGQYSCGWWRAYDNGWDASALKFVGKTFKCNLPGGRQPIPPKSNCYYPGTAVTEGGLMGPPGGNSWFSQLVYALRNCKRCTQWEGALKNPFTDNPKYSTFFMGTVMPWVCNVHPNGGAEYVFPYTVKKDPNHGNKYIDCYCDNEPAAGRTDHPLEPSWHMGLLYCALVKNSKFMDCVLITFEKGDWSKAKCTLYECGGYSKTTDVFQLTRDDWHNW